MKQGTALALGTAGAIPPLATLVAEAAGDIPGIDVLADLAPPLVKPIVALVTGGAAVAITVWGAKPWSDAPAKLATRALQLVLLSVLLMIPYLLALQSWTEGAPADRPGIDRTQIGFGVAEWTLTEEGNRILQALIDSEAGEPTPEFLLLSKSAHLDDDNVKLIWKPWTVNLAATLLALLYFLVLFIWSLGFALLDKQIRAEEVRMET